jgi:hypothetical protein
MIVSSTDGTEKKWIPIYKRFKSNFYLYLIQQSTQKWTEHLNIRPGTVKLLREN